MQCEHLKSLKTELDGFNIPMVYSGQPWGMNCREWIYYDCVLDAVSIIERLDLPSCIEVHINNDMKSGLEQGLKCNICHDAIIGIHPDVGKGKKVIH